MSGSETVEVHGHAIRISNPEKVFFPRPGFTKMDLVRYYLGVAPAALVGARDRPTTLYRFPDGVDGASFYQKRVPHPPPWARTVTVAFPSGRTARMLVVHDAAHIAWAVNLGCIDLNPWPVRDADVDHPDELRVDLDPTPRIPWDHVRRTAMLVRDVLGGHGLEGFPKTSGKRGIHVSVRIETRWGFTEVRRAALALAREVERRSEGMATTAWWKEHRRGVFVDYNQNARDRTVASAYSVRPVPDALVSCPLAWDEVPDVDPRDLRLDTVPARVATLGDPGSAIDRHVGTLEPLLAMAARDEAGGLGDAPWPPHFPKASGEPVRASPSRRRRSAG
ncbi:MAG: ATP-dependent DNA ligase [Actinomycetota bacterium]|nr:ATP-dependent DNA ligase [Actinomycetota bacterium]